MIISRINRSQNERNLTGSMVILVLLCFYAVSNRGKNKSCRWSCINPLSANFPKWSNTFKQFVGKHISEKQTQNTLHQYKTHRVSEIVICFKKEAFHLFSVPSKTISTTKKNISVKIVNIIVKIVKIMNLIFTNIFFYC